METETWLSCHNKFISAENITVLSVESIAFFYMQYFKLHNSKYANVESLFICVRKKKEKNFKIIRRGLSGSKQ